MTRTGVDTSVAVPLLVQTHDAHAAVIRWRGRRELALCGHALVETYSVLTRLPGDIRLTPRDAARLIESHFAPPLILDLEAAGRMPSTLAALGVAGGAVYDALIGIAAVEHDCPLATRDERATSTYEAVGATVVRAV